MACNREVKKAGVHASMRGCFDEDEAFRGVDAGMGWREVVRLLFAGKLTCRQQNMSTRMIGERKLLRIFPARKTFAFSFSAYAFQTSASVRNASV
ncbi:hypothetical protein [Dyella telluris]|uniref:Uncharacterized protein n=1 Tax=Dyella telluris TaxID=2763498 RepID=A0A7G8Q1N3_9GAMM|nr:hypothetical protein [Dyella telluris]QNK00691.1 hypothetical protein H8F01_16590 [Dyella telluris]